MKDRRVRFNIKLQIELEWLNPPENPEEESERQQVQQLIDNATDTLAEELGDHLYKRMVALGAMEPIEEGEKNDISKTKP